MVVSGILRISGILGIMFNGQVPKIPDIPCLYYFMLFLEVIRISNTISIDYADLPYHLIPLSPYFYGHPDNIFSPHPPRPHKL